MNTTVSAIAAQNALHSPPVKAKAPSSSAAADPKLRQAFDAFVGEAFFAQTLKSMRKTLGKPAYFHGGRAEEVFGQQLDQILAEKIGKNNAGRMANSLGSLNQLPRR